jgi:hypothetical protein
MVVETKLVKTQQEENHIEDGEKIDGELEKAMKEHASVKRLIDLFFLGLFLVFIMYTII